MDFDFGAYLTSNFFTLVFLGIVASLVWGYFQRKKQAEAREALHAEQADAARAEGIHLTAQPEGPVVMHSPLGQPVVGGETRYEGIDHGIAWELTSKTGVTRDDSPGTAHRVWSTQSIWKTRDVLWPEGKYLMIMSTPGEIKTNEVKQDGFLGKIVNAAANLALDLYVSQYFGSKYAALINLSEEAEIIKKTGFEDFFVLTNEPYLAEQFLTEPAVRAISAWKKENQGFTQESGVDQFGVLFAPDACLVTCRAAMASPAEARRYAGFAAGLAVNMQGVLR